MQKSLGTIFLLLFLCLLLSVILVSYSYSDFRNSLQSNSSTVLDLDMQRGNQMSSRKRFFQDLENEGTSAASKTFAHEHINAETIVDRHTFQDEQHAFNEFDTGMSDYQQSANYKLSKKTMFFKHLGDEGTSASENTSNDNENTIVRDVLENSFSFGQACYQKAKQDVIIQYKDHHDNIFQCVHCNAYYWRDEENSRGIYTSCCQEGQHSQALAMLHSPCSSISSCHHHFLYPNRSPTRV